MRDLEWLPGVWAEWKHECESRAHQMGALCDTETRVSWYLSNGTEQWAEHGIQGQTDRQQSQIGWHCSRATLDTQPGLGRGSN